MKIRYRFADGEATEVEVSDDIGSIIIDSRRTEEAANRKEHRHCYSLDGIKYEGEEYGEPDFTETMFDESEERNICVQEAFSHLSEIQKRRLILLSVGLSVREIARQEGKNFKSVYESIEAAKKKFLKIF